MLDYFDSRICCSRLFGGVQGNYARSMSLAVQGLRDFVGCAIRLRLLIDFKTLQRNIENLQVCSSLERMQDVK